MLFLTIVGNWGSILFSVAFFSSLRANEGSFLFLFMAYSWSENSSCREGFFVSVCLLFPNYGNSSQLSREQGWFNSSWYCEFTLRIFSENQHLNWTSSARSSSSEERLIFTTLFWEWRCPNIGSSWIGKSLQKSVPIGTVWFAHLKELGAVFGELETLLFFQSLSFMFSSWIGSSFEGREEIFCVDMDLLIMFAF